MKAGTFIADTREKDAWETDPRALAAAACVRGVVASIDVPREAEEAARAEALRCLEQVLAVQELAMPKPAKQGRRRWLWGRK